jgi:replication initiation protein RepC
VFPSNKELSIRAHGMAPATLRRHLACLVDAGLIIRRDSPNGKRFARRGQGGAIEDAFGFDLTPLVARAEEIESLAEEVRAENRAIALLREKITLARRDIAKMIAIGIEEGIPGDWQGFHLRYATLSGRYARNLIRAELEALASELATLATEIRKLLENHVKAKNMSANESQNERHIQNQATKIFDLEPGLQEGRAEPSGLNDQEPRAPSAPEPEILETSGQRPEQKPGSARTYPLGMVLEACPDILDFASGGISSWRDLATTAAVVRSAIGVSPDAWAQALEVLGEHDASIVIAAILQRGEEIKSAGGYLRVLTAKARAGEFSLGPVLMALLRGKAAKAARERKRAG